MRSFAKLLIVAVLGMAVSTAIRAETPAPRQVYTDALLKERALRRDIETRRSDATVPSLLKRVRSLVGTYERMSRQFPSSGYMDNALWQGALLAADAFWAFGEAADKETALELFSALSARFPNSSLVKQTPAQVKRLRQARIVPPAARPAAAPPPPSRTDRGATSLTAVRRDVLPDVVRITLELGEEVPFRSDRIGGPPRVYVDLDNTRPADAVKDATIPFPDDVVRQVRVGRHSASRTRVVMDLAGAGRHSIYTLYNPYRVVIDFARTSTAPAPPVLARLAAASAGPALSEKAVAPAKAPPEIAVAPAAADADSAVSVEPAVDESAAPVAEGPPAPVPPSANVSGGFSLSRQLGLGVSRVVIDPGHGGHDPGARTRGLTEADLVLDVALRLEKLLLTQDGFEVVLTRRVDTFVPLEERTAIANREGADLFLSIHANASVNRAARGVETYFLNLTANPDAEAVAARENAASSRSMRQLPDIVKAIALNNKIQESRDFATMVQGALSSQLQKTDGAVRNLGVKQAPFLVLLGATMPSVLAEISFITNRQDAALLKTEKHRQRIADAIYAGIVRYQQSLKVAPAVAEQ